MSRDGQLRLRSNQKISALAPLQSKFFRFDSILVRIKNMFYSYEKLSLFHRKTCMKMLTDSYKSTNHSSLKQLFWLEMRRILQKT